MHRLSTEVNKVAATATVRRWLSIAAAGALAALAAGCGDGGKDERGAYDACLATAKKAGSPIADAQFAKFEDAKAAGMQDSSIGVIIPYELAGKKGSYQCNAMKQQDGSFKVTQ
ncbi:MAG TPA: hypothetical protein VMV26_06935 [Alphaproteobacteria bacterium]|jgi:hypothetical protein|nr:hypothetical protein [Alphaproteobacteria bacterium]